MKSYKLRHKESGLFLTRRYNESKWFLSKRGKVWQKRPNWTWFKWANIEDDLSFGDFEIVEYDSERPFVSIQEVLDILEKESGSMKSIEIFEDGSGHIISGNDKPYTYKGRDLIFEDWDELNETIKFIYEHSK